MNQMSSLILNMPQCAGAGVGPETAGVLASGKSHCYLEKGRVGGWSCSIQSKQMERPQINHPFRSDGPASNAQTIFPRSADIGRRQG